VDREHLNEGQLDELIDDETGTAHPAERAHLQGCVQCRRALARARDAVRMLEYLPYRSPSPMFSVRVMRGVTVFKPPHLALLDSLEQLAPARGGLRFALASAAAVVAMALTSLFVWAGWRADQVAFAASLGIEQGRLAALNFAEQLAAALVGEPTMLMLGLRGAGSIWFMLSLLGACVLLSAMVLRAVARIASRASSGTGDTRTPGVE
jgi:hypothetical protein